MDLEATLAKYQPDMEAVSNWFDTFYQNKFAQYFQIERDLSKRLQSEDYPITDTELEQILIDVPLDLFDAAEALNEFKLSNEVIKLHIKTDEDKSSIEEAKLMSSIMNSVAERVTSEISFSRELIMGAKKIWDSRRATESLTPISESIAGQVDNLPDYTPSKRI